jgi:polysaccharide biosynthesis transport protein
MSEDKLIPMPPSGAEERRPLPSHRSGTGAIDEYRGAPYPAFEPEDEGLDLRRYLMALYRFKWLFLVALLVAGGASYWVWQTTPLRYRTNGSLWIERGGGVLGNQGPIEPGSLLENNAWVQLLRSHTVLDSVVVQLRLYLHAGEYGGAFRTFVPREDMRRGAFELRVGPGGDHYVLLTPEGVVLEEGRLGGPVGHSLGWDWVPPAGSLPAGATVNFAVQSPREAALNLDAQIRTSMDYQGNFLDIAMSGTNPQHITRVINALLERHVAVSAELTRLRLDETLLILEDQLRFTARQLEEAERELEQFRVTTITYPSELSAVAPGLEETRNPVINNFFEMRIELEEVRRDRARLQEALEEIATTGVVNIATLELIPSAARSSELQRILADLVGARSELRALTNRYSNDHPLVRDVLTQIENFEQRSIPNVVRGIVAELQNQELQRSSRVSVVSAELEAIPPRTIQEGRLRRSVVVTEELYNDLRRRVEQARLAAASAIPEIRILDRAQAPETPLEDERTGLILTIFLGCLGAAAGGALLLDRMDAKFRYATDVSREIGLGILGSIPRIEAKGGRQGVLNAAQALEAFRELRIHVGFAYGSAGPLTLAISSPAAGEGKSLISSNLAVAFAEVGQRTLLIDGDTRRGDAHHLFGLEQSPGLIDYLRGRSPEENIQQTAHANLDFIGCGARGISTPELLASSRMAELLGRLKRKYDVIIVDCPPLASGGDPVILSTLTGNLAVVIRTGSTEKQLTQAKLDQLAGLPIRILGAILNDVDPSDGYHYYYASYLPGYEPVPTEEDGEEGLQLISRGSGTAG